MGGGKMKKLNYIDIGNRIRIKRKANNVTQEKLAEHCDISVGFLSNIETGNKTASLETLYKISLSLKASLDYLIFGFETDDNYIMPILDNIKQYHPEKYIQLKNTIIILAEHIEEM